MEDMLDNKPHLYNKEDEYGRFFLLRMLFKHIELFSLWKKSNNSFSNKPESSLYEITLELIEEIKRLEPSINIKSYKKVAGKFALSISDLAKVLSPKEPTVKFYFYLYVLHRELLASLAANNEAVKYSQADSINLKFWLTT